MNRILPIRSPLRLALVASVFAIGLGTPAQGATTSKALLACQNRLAAKVKSFASFTANKIHGCTEKVVDCKLSSEIDAADDTSCLASATTACSGIAALVASKRAAAETKIAAKCGLIPGTDLNQFVAGLGFSNVAAGCGGLSSASAIVDCVLDGTKCSVEQQVFIRDPRAQDSLTTAGIASSFPCVGPPFTPTSTPTETPTVTPTVTP